MDIGSAVSRALGIDDETLASLSRWRESDRFSDVERLALELTEAMSGMPADVPEALREQLLEHLSPGQYAELVFAIGWENWRARTNRALGVREVGFSDGAYCVRPLV